MLMSYKIKDIAGVILLCCCGCTGFKYVKNYGFDSINIDSCVWRFDSYRIDLNRKSIITVNPFASNIEILYLYPAHNTCFKIVHEEDIVEYDGKSIKVLNNSGSKHITDLELGEFIIQLSYNEIRYQYKGKSQNICNDLFIRKSDGRKILYISSNGNGLSLVCRYNWYEWSVL